MNESELNEDFKNHGSVSFLFKSQKNIMISVFKNNFYHGLMSNLEYLRKLGELSFYHFCHPHQLRVDLITTKDILLFEAPQVLSSGYAITNALIVYKMQKHDKKKFCDWIFLNCSYNKEFLLYVDDLWNIADVVYTKSWETFILPITPYTPEGDLSEVFEVIKDSDVFELYVVLFDYGVIKVGKSKCAEKRVEHHGNLAGLFGRKIVKFFIERNPKISEEDLINFCAEHGKLFAGAEYFSDLNYADVVSFVKNDNLRSNPISSLPSS